MKKFKKIVAALAILAGLFSNPKAFAPEGAKEVTGVAYKETKEKSG